MGEAVKRSKVRVISPVCWPVVLPAVRFWLAWNEMAFHAAVVIGLRTTSLAAAFWMRKPVPTRELARMFREKRMAAFESVSGVGAAVLRRPGNIDPAKLATAALKPYRKHTRGNVRRLRKGMR